MPLKDVILTKKVERHIEKHGVTRIMDVLNGFKYVRRKGKRFLYKNEMIHDEESEDKDGKGLRRPA